MGQNLANLHMKPFLSRQLATLRECRNAQVFLMECKRVTLRQLPGNQNIQEDEKAYLLVKETMRCKERVHVELLMEV